MRVSSAHRRVWWRWWRGQHTARVDSDRPDDHRTARRQPGGSPAQVGQTATFSVTASGTAPLSYQWRRDGADIAGATAASYSTAALNAGDDGAKFSVVVSTPSAR
jgi:beta-galactosidase